MNVDWVAAPWHSQLPSRAWFEAIEVIGDNVWAEAAGLFHASRQEKIAKGQSAPKGAQAFVNRVLEERFQNAGWAGSAGRFVKNQTWVRITFRHQMSLGSDILDAIKAVNKGGFSEAFVLAGDDDFLQVVTPNDASALCSFSKFERALTDCDGVLSIPLFIGRLTAKTNPPESVARDLRIKPRPRDHGVPS